MDQMRIELRMPMPEEAGSMFLSPANVNVGNS
jgi:hypothetical protein